jgi:hypothetical protein
LILIKHEELGGKKGREGRKRTIEQEKKRNVQYS